MTDAQQIDHPTPDEPFDLMETLDLIATEGLQVERRPGEGLTVRSPHLGKLQGASVEPCFPITEFGKYVLLMDADGEEIGILEDIAKLDRDSAEALEAELKEQHFIPTITRIYDISREFHIPVWDVETDRGRRRLELKRRRDVHRMQGGRIYVRDADGNGYLIPDIRMLDPLSRSLIDTNT